MNKTYLEQYTELMSKPKEFTVEFYKEYEGEGGYWNVYDEWVSGETVHEVVEKKTFSTIESALHFADVVQERILNEERKRYADARWLSESNFRFGDTDNNQIIYAHINWGGSSYKMVLDYNIIQD